MKLRETTRNIIASLEKKSGYLVQVVVDNTLPALATLKIAGGKLPAHVLTYKSGPHFESPDFAICWQCVFALRLYQCPPQERYLIAANQEGDQAMDALLKAPNGIAQTYRVNKPELETLKQQLLSGLISHLRSIPIGFRVSETLAADYPGILDLEVLHVEKELTIGKEGLSARVKEMMPAEIYKAIICINAAYALFWATRFEYPAVAHPYHPGGFDGYGQQLLDIYQLVPNDPLHDCELVNRWADYLKIRSWYDWLPYQVS